MADDSPPAPSSSPSPSSNDSDYVVVHVADSSSPPDITFTTSSPLDVDANGGDDDDLFDAPISISESSKREYLLAQIRQKDAIIESLLKQVSELVSSSHSSFLFFLSLHIG